MKTKTTRQHQITAAILAIVSITFLMLSGCVSQNINNTDTTTTTELSPTTTTVASANLRIAEISLPGMFCQSCVQSSESAFRGMVGVTDAKVDFGTKKGTVIYDSSKIRKEELVQNALIQAYDGKILNDRKYEPS